MYRETHRGWNLALKVRSDSIWKYLSRRFRNHACPRSRVDGSVAASTDRKTAKFSESSATPFFAAQSTASTIKRSLMPLTSGFPSTESSRRIASSESPRPARHGT